MKAIVLSIGDELVSGLTVNTNASWLAGQLGGLGVETIAHLSVGDDLQAIATAIRQSCEQLEREPSREGMGEGTIAGVLVVTGGLGPTEDDLTRQALADAVGQTLVEDPDAMLQVERFFRSVNRPMSPSNRLQALRPEHATVMENPLGTAPGLRLTCGRVAIFVMPGVPREMQEMYRGHVPTALGGLLTGSPGDAKVVRRVVNLHTFGRGESVVGESIKDLMNRGGVDGEPGVRVGTTAHEGIVSVRIYATGQALPGHDGVDGAIERVSAIVRQRLGTLIFGQGDETLEGAAAQLLKDGRHTLATAESCTGGMLAALLTNVPGSSAYFLRGWVTYANNAKHDELGVPAELIKDHGAVSGEVARAMALGARRYAETDFAVGITGVAGPDGGSADKPVGTVWIAVVGPSGDQEEVRRFNFSGERAMVRMRAAHMALAMLRWKLLGVPWPV